MTLKMSYRQQLLLVFGVVGMAMTCVDRVTSQVDSIPTLFVDSQAVQSSTMGSQMLPVNSSATSSLFSSDTGSDDGQFSDEGSFSEGSVSDEDGEESESGSWDYGSGSSSLEYGCDCRSVRRVSLMGASDYCLAPGALLSSKCGNVDLGDSGACPIVGAQPCSPKGHVLANDSFCALDDKDETYKCVASKNDLEIQKKGKKKRKQSKRHHGSESSTSTASSHLLLTARQILLAVVVCWVMMAVV